MRKAICLLVGTYILVTPSTFLLWSVLQKYGFTDAVAALITIPGVFLWMVVGQSLVEAGKN